MTGVGRLYSRTRVKSSNWLYVEETHIVLCHYTESNTPVCLHIVLTYVFSMIDKDIDCTVFSTVVLFSYNTSKMFSWPHNYRHLLVLYAHIIIIMIIHIKHISSFDLFCLSTVSNDEFVVNMYDHTCNSTPTPWRYHYRWLIIVRLIFHNVTILLIILTFINVILSRRREKIIILKKTQLRNHLHTSPI